jgi:hypothetical protein
MNRRALALGALVALLVVAAVGVFASRGDPHGSALVSASATKGTLLEAPAASSAVRAPVPEPRTATAFRGKVGTQDVVVRLAGTADEIEGSYFYVHVGSSLKLAGAERGDTLTLTEKADGAVTGRFELHRHGAGLEGTWTAPKGNRRLDVALEPVATRRDGEPAILLKRRLRTKIAPDDKGASPGKACAIDVAFPEVVGLASAAAEKAINAAWSPDAAIERHGTALCEDEATWANTFEVFLNTQNLVSVCLSERTDDRRRADDPIRAGECSTWDLNVGRALKAEELGVDLKALEAPLLALLRKEGSEGPEEHARSLAHEPDGFAVTPCGIDLYAGFTSMAMRALTDLHYLVPYHDIKGLRPASPLAQLAARAANPCTDPRAKHFPETP